MKKILVADCCIRGEKSRTKLLLDALLLALTPEAEIEYLTLDREELRPLTGEFFEEREQLLAEGRLDHPRFRYAHQFAQADEIVIAAPFWDLSFPALLKIYIENLCVDGITFTSEHGGLRGLCRAKHLVYITSRGGIFTDSPLEMGSRYMDAMHSFFGIDNYRCLAMDGMDMSSVNKEDTFIRAMNEAACIAEELLKED